MEDIDNTVFYSFYPIFCLLCAASAGGYAVAYLFQLVDVFLILVIELAERVRLFRKAGNIHNRALSDVLQRLFESLLLFRCKFRVFFSRIVCNDF